MSFLYPSFLWALLTLAIPILIHIFNFRKVRKIYFTNVRFLKELKTQSNSFKTLREILILLMRLGLLASLVLAFAQPFFKKAGAESTFGLSATQSIYLDNSYSMQNQRNKKTHLASLKENMRELLKVFPKAAKFQLFTNDFSAKEQFVVNAAKIEDMLSQINFSARVRSLNEINGRQLALLSKTAKSAKNQIFWLSDFQKSTIGDLNKLKLDTQTTYHLIPIKATQQKNLGIDSAWLANPFVKESEQNTLHFLVHNHGEEGQDELVLRLYIDDLQVSTSTINVAGKSKAEGSFSFTIQGKGAKKAKIVLDDEPLHFDNEYFFALNVAPTIRIAYVYAGAGNPYIRNVYANEQSFRVETYDQNTFNINIINNIDLLILENMQNFSNEWQTALKNFVEQGGSLLVFPAEKPNLSNYVTMLSDLGVRGLQIEQKDSLGKNSSKVLLPPNISNNFYNGIFEKNPQNTDMPYANAVLSWTGVNSQLLGFKNGKNFLSEFKNGQGKLYLCASPMDTRFTDFPKNALFLPIMYKIASKSGQQNEQIAYRFQDKIITMKVQKPNKNEVFKLKNANTELIPAQRVEGEKLVLELPEQVAEAGHYELINSQMQKIGILAFNYEAKESEMNFYTSEELKQLFSTYKNVKIYDKIDDKNFIENFKESNIARPLWKYFLIAALVFMLLEILFIRFFKQKPQQKSQNF
ncbi:MAG: BatA domain-containing protein [Thermonemataceae bacterium]|nr:BatA domain-containing protein [Thermonemataceae bacterium]